MTDDDLDLITRWVQVAKLRDDGALTPAELTLIAAAERGETAQISPTLPNLRAPHIVIRASLLRYLILGGCPDFRTQPSGITVNGAWISGTLNLSFTQAHGPIDLYNCDVAARPELVQLRADGLALVGCALREGINCSRLQVSGNVTLNRSYSDGKISLSGADIQGHLSCADATWRNPGGSAFKAQGVTVKGSILLGGVHAEGLVSLLGTEVGGQLVCADASFSNLEGHALNAQSTRIRGDVFLRDVATEGETSLLGAEINGVLDCSRAILRNPAGRALNAQGVVVREGLIWRKVGDVGGAVDLTSARVGGLWDDPESWAKCDGLFLSGFVYDVLHGTIDEDERLAWLKKGAISAREFYPQPYEQLAKLLRETGHRAHARAIMVAKEKEQRKASRARWRRERQWRRDLITASLTPQAERSKAIARLAEDRPADENLARLVLLHPVEGAADFIDPLTLSYAQRSFRSDQRWFNLGKQVRHVSSLVADRILGLVVGYGHKPERSFYMLLTLVLIGWFLADKAWQAGDFAPAAAPVLMSESWQALAVDPGVANPAQVWSDKHAVTSDGARTLTAGRDYETFNAIAYAVDIVVPIVSLGQETSWAPSTTRGPWGWWLWWIRWLLISLGWIVTAIGAAAVTGVIRRD